MKKECAALTEATIDPVDYIDHIFYGKRGGITDAALMALLLDP